MSAIATLEDAALFRNAINMAPPEQYLAEAEGLDCIGLSLIAMSHSWLATGTIPMVREVIGGPGLLIKKDVNFGHLYLVADPHDYSIPSPKGPLSYSKGVTIENNNHNYPDLEPEVLSRFPDFRQNILINTWGVMEGRLQRFNSWIPEHPEFLGLSAGPGFDRSLALQLMKMADKLGVSVLGIDMTLLQAKCIY